ncbi:MAG: hypothetical protein ACI8X5_000027 [Planctomycetota bacterium]|jgi:hypothetical protein
MQTRHDTIGQPRTRGARPRRGSVLVEFAMVSFLLYLLLVVLLDFGRATLAAQTIQDASTVLANELARAPLPATMTFEEAMADDYVNSVIYDPNSLVMSFGAGATSQEIDLAFAALPIVNQMLRPLMYREESDSGGVLYRYPGALVASPDGLTVFVPKVVDRDWSGQQTGGFETIVFRPVMEEIHDPAIAPNGHFAINSGSSLAGFVNLRCNYPYQAAAMTANHPDEGVFGPLHAVQASDAAVQIAPGGELPSGYSLVAAGASEIGSPYAGQFGLGFHWVGTKKVRPFRKLLSVQAAARREVIVPAPK